MIEADLIKRSNRKTVAISITTEGNVVLKIPQRMPMQTVEQFLFEKQDWIASKLETIRKNREDFSTVIEYRKFMLLGVEYDVFRSDKVKKVTFDGDRFLIPKSLDDDKAMPNIKNWYKKFARDILTKRFEELERHIRLKAKNLRVTDAKGRWGSCNERGEICLNFKIVMMRPRLIDYVIIHELSHLVELNHSPKFWKVVELVMEDFMSLRGEIRKYNFLLKMF